MNEGKNVLAIGAHPDDLEILCGGTLARYSKSGYRVFMYHVTNGEKGGIGKTHEEIIRERREEAIQSAAVIDAISLGGSTKDGEVVLDLENRMSIVDVIRACDPEVVFTHSPQDYHTDHSNVSRLVFEASYMVCIPNLETEHKALKRLPRLYYMDTVAGIGFEPREYVDISPVFDLKVEMLRQHKSQLKFVMDLSQVDFIEMAEVSARYRGFQCNVKYAEGFVEHNVWPRQSTARVLP